MTKVYLLAPLIALAAFGTIYGKYARAFDARVEETKRADTLAKQAKLDQQAAAQQQAQRDATAAVARRQAERAEKERQDETRKQARRDAEERRTAAIESERRLHQRLERLKQEIAQAGDSVKHHESQVAELEREQVFLAAYVQEAAVKRDKFNQLLERLELLERNRLAAAPSSPAAPARSRP